jgi:hypothetical protein
MRRSLTLRDPFEGSAEFHRRLRLRIEGIIALALALAACLLTGIMWLRTLAPIAHQFGLG